MKTSSILAAAGLLIIAQAQSQCNSVASAVPACATSCIQSAATKVGCGVLDYVCQCGAASSAAINSAAFGCVLATCGPTTGLAVQTSAAAVCACASSVGGGASSAAPASSSAMVSSMAGSSMAGSSMASSMMGSSTAGSSMAASSMMASGPAMAGGSASMASPTGAASMASSAAPAGTPIASSPASAAPFTGAGLQVILSVGAGLALFLGLLAAM